MKKSTLFYCVLHIVLYATSSVPKEVLVKSISERIIVVNRNRRFGGAWGLQLQG